MESIESGTRFQDKLSRKRYSSSYGNSDSDADVDEVSGLEDATTTATRNSGDSGRSNLSNRRQTVAASTSGRYEACISYVGKIKDKLHVC